MTDSSLFPRLKEMGLKEVKENIAQGKAGSVGSEHHNSVLAWVALEEEALSAASSAKRDAREEETLSIARQARADAKLANIIAIAAIIIAIVAIVVSKSN
jgi:hypothetical protein